MKHSNSNEVAEKAGIPKGNTPHCTNPTRKRGPATLHERGQSHRAAGLLEH